MKAKAKKHKVGPSNTHFKIRHLDVVGTIYVSNDVMAKYPDLEEITIEIPEIEGE